MLCPYEGCLSELKPRLERIIGKSEESQRPRAVRPLRMTKTFLGGKRMEMIQESRQRTMAGATRGGETVRSSLRGLRRARKRNEGLIRDLRESRVSEMEANGPTRV